MRFVVGPVLVVALAGGCDHGSGALSDAAIDDSQDISDTAALDAAADAAVDAPDFSSEGECEGPSPACTTAPTTFFPITTGTFVVSMKSLGNTMYVATYDSANGGTVTEGRVTVIDVTTGTPTGTLFDHTVVSLTKADGWIYAVDNAGGSIWRFKPGAAPVEIVSNRPSPRAVTADADYVYWAENDPTLGMQVLRQAFASGSPQFVMACPQPYRLRVDDTHVYCQEFDHGILAAPLTGTTTPDEILYSTYPLVSMVQCGATIYSTAIGDHVLFTVPLPDGPGAATTSIVSQLPPRITGLAASANHIYITSSRGIYRVSRADDSYTPITALLDAETDGMVHNGQFFFFSRDIGVRRCID